MTIPLWFIVSIVLGVSIAVAAWFFGSNYVYAPLKEKRKNSEKENAYLHSPLITYETVMYGHSIERKEMEYRHRNEIIQLEARQQEQLMEWINYHATPQFYINPNDDYRNTTI